MGSLSPVTSAIQREQFASKSTIALFLCAVTMILYLFFPKDDILGDIFHQAKPSVVTAEYLQDLLHIYPNDVKLRLLLVKEYIYLNDVPKAEAEMKHIPNIKDAGLRWRVQWLQYLLQRAKVWSIPVASPLRLSATESLKSQMHQLLTVPLTVNELLTLAHDGLSFGEISLTKEINTRVKKISHVLSASQYVSAAEVAIAVGDYRNSAHFYFQAQTISPELILKRRYFQNGLRALQQGDLGKEALRAAEERMATLDLDRQSMMLVVRLALAANEPELAQIYIQRALQLKRGDE